MTFRGVNILYHCWLNVFVPFPSVRLLLNFAPFTPLYLFHMYIGRVHVMSCLLRHILCCAMVGWFFFYLAVFLSPVVHFAYSGRSCRRTVCLQDLSVLCALPATSSPLTARAAAHGTLQPLVQR